MLQNIITEYMQALAQDSSAAEKHLPIPTNSLNAYALQRLISIIKHADNDGLHACLYLLVFSNMAAGQNTLIQSINESDESMYSHLNVVGFYANLHDDIDRTLTKSTDINARNRQHFFTKLCQHYHFLLLSQDPQFTNTISLTLCAITLFGAYINALILFSNTTVPTLTAVELIPILCTTLSAACLMYPPIIYPALKLFYSRPSTRYRSHTRSFKQLYHESGFLRPLRRLLNKANEQEQIAALHITQQNTIMQAIASNWRGLN